MRGRTLRVEHVVLHFIAAPCLHLAALPLRGAPVRLTGLPAAHAPCDPGRYRAWAVATPRHIEIFVSPTSDLRRSSSSSKQTSISREVGNAIQLAMVDRALQRRYGDEPDVECACESEP
jgi:hypothetical protein